MTSSQTRDAGDDASDRVRTSRRWRGGHDPADGPTALAWIDSREATIVRVRDGRFPLEHLESDVPVHHRSTGHIRHRPSIRHGGGGPAQTAGEPHRLEHLARFVATVARRLEGEPDVMIVGPGTVREHLARQLRGSIDPGEERRVHTEPAAPMTDRQLVALLRQLAGREPRRGRRSGSEPPASWEPFRPTGWSACRSPEQRRRRIADVIGPVGAG